MALNCMARDSRARNRGLWAGALSLVFVMAGATVGAAWGAVPQKKGQAKDETPDGEKRAEIYYDVSMAHLYQQEYESGSKSEDANQAIDYLKKAYALDPNSQVIGEELAELYYITQRIRDAVTEAQAILKREPQNLPARRLLSHIYLRTLETPDPGSDEHSTMALAIEQLREIMRLDPTDTDSELWLARLYRLENQNDQAEQVLRAVLAEDPNEESAAGQLAQLLLDANKPDEAIALLEDILKRVPSASLDDQLGDALTQEHNLTDAEQAYRQSVALEPGEASHLQELAQCLFDEQKYQDAIEPYQELVGLQPDEANHYLRLSEIYSRLHQLDKAEAQVLLAKQHEPGNLEVIYNEAQIYQEEGRTDDAIHVISDALSTVKGQTEVTPTRRRTLAILYQLLGQIHRDTGDYTAAVGAFEDLAALGPEEDARARVLIVESYSAAHDLPHAFAEAAKGLAAHPNDRDLELNQALLYGENNQPDQAAGVLRPMLRQSPDDFEIYLDLAQVYSEDHRYADGEEAVQAAEKVVSRPDDRETLGLVLGGLYDQQKKYEQAEQVFEGVLAINPHNAPVLNYYGYMLADRGVRLDDAAGLIQRALVEDPDNPAYLDSLGWTYYQQNKLEDAERYIRKAIEHGGHDPEILSHLGDVLAKSGRTDLAAEEWDKSLAEWHRSLPAEFDAEKVGALEQKISNLKLHAAQEKNAGDTKAR